LCGLLFLVSASASYVESQANLMVKYAAASYCCGTLGSGVVDWSCHICQQIPYLNTTVFTDRTTGTNGYVGSDPAARTIIVAFAGTDPLRISNWIDDLNFAKVSYPLCNAQGCQVHKGFFNQYNKVQSQILTAITYYLYFDPKAPIYVTGHSMGAALSVLCSLDVQDQLGVQVLPLYNFGLPRLGDTAFAAYVEKELTLWRVTHWRDPVPHLPLEAMGFRHPSTEVFYTSSNDAFTVCDGSGEDPKCSDQFALAVNLLDHLTYMKLDFTANYLYCKL
jgi:predicted lipase